MDELITMINDEVRIHLLDCVRYHTEKFPTNSGVYEVEYLPPTRLSFIVELPICMKITVEFTNESASEKVTSNLVSESTSWMLEDKNNFGSCVVALTNAWAKSADSIYKSTEKAVPRIYSGM